MPFVLRVFIIIFFMLFVLLLFFCIMYSFLMIHDYFKISNACIISRLFDEIGFFHVCRIEIQIIFGMKVRITILCAGFCWNHLACLKPGKKKDEYFITSANKRLQNWHCFITSLFSQSIFSHTVQSFSFLPSFFSSH